MDRICRSLSVTAGNTQLEMHNVPATALSVPSRIANFFSPIAIKEYVCRFPNNGGSSWIARFYSQQDKDLAMELKQWQYLDDYCIRLMSVDEGDHTNARLTWAFVHHDLQLDMLSYFDVFRRPRLRRVCKRWDTLLELFWDQQVNRCLYFDLKSDGMKQFEDGLTAIEEWRTALRLVDGRCKQSGFTVPRLIVRFHNGTGGRLYAEDAGLSNFEDSRRRLVETFLIEHSHFNMVMLVGLLCTDYNVCEDMFQFFGQQHWPRPLTIVFSDCTFAFYHSFPEYLDDNGMVVFTTGFDAWSYELPVRHLVFRLDEQATKRVRYLAFYRELDKQGVFWPYPREQLTWLQSVLDSVPVDEPEELGMVEENDTMSYSPRWALRRYFEREAIRKIVDEWEPTGVSFEQIRLSRRDCFLLAVLTTQRALLGTSFPPFKMDFPLLDFLPEEIGLDFAELPSEGETFAQQVAALSVVGPGHCKIHTGSQLGS